MLNSDGVVFTSQIRRDNEFGVWNNSQIEVGFVRKCNLDIGLVIRVNVDHSMKIKILIPESIFKNLLNI